jgi:hypothetical protein
MPYSPCESGRLKGHSWPAQFGSFIIASLLFGFCLAKPLPAMILARDADTELSIDPPGSPNTSGIFSFARFADSASEEDFNFSGSLKVDGKLYQLEQPPDQKSKASVVIDGDANAESLPEEIVRLQVLRELTMSRIKFIQSLLNKSLPAGINAVYHDEYGGELDLEKDGHGIKFRLSVVRGPTAHTGDVSGRVILRNGRGIYRDPQPLEGEQPAEITFQILDDRRVEIKARNDAYLHGARAYFDGVYFKSDPLTD